MAGEPAQNALTVSQAMGMAKSALENVTVTIMGEVSEVSVKPGYKAAYFTVKDAGAALPCMMWNNRYKAAGMQLAVGQLVLVTGRFTLYAAKGRMNFDVFSLALSGEGELRMRVAAIAKRLAAEGLTDPARKRPLPEMPERIGLVTSPRSAAVHDVLRTLRRRFPIAQVLLAGVPVEGASAPQYVAEGIRCVAQAGAQVVLVVRGGGSFEDLMPFNDEMLARTIAACPVPVVTGIGHEVDTSIADMVADLRASTPTAAAEAVSPSREALESYLRQRTADIGTSAYLLLERAGTKLANVAARPMFQDPMRLFANEAMALDVASERLALALPRNVEGARRRVEDARAGLLRVGGALVERPRREMALAAARLQDLSPLGVLARGYAITRDGNGAVVKSVEQAPAGSRVAVSVADGTLDCLVEQVSRNQPV